MIRVENKRSHSGPGEYVGRPSSLGNPFVVGKDGTRDEVVSYYREWLDNELNRDANGKVGALFFRLLRQYREAGELTLICWCAPQACHADVVREELERRA